MMFREADDFIQFIADKNFLITDSPQLSPLPALAGAPSIHTFSPILPSGKPSLPLALRLIARVCAIIIIRDDP
jgi:hypothetical protein